MPTYGKQGSGGGGVSSGTIDSTLALNSGILGVAGWHSNAQRFLFSKVAALTQYVPWQAGISNIAGPTTPAAGAGADGALEGGALISGNAVVTKLDTVPFTQNSKTKPWGFILRGSFDTNGVGAQQIGLINAGGLHSAVIVAQTSIDATHFVLSTNAGGTVNQTLSLADAAIHDFALTFDLTTITAWIDGVSVGTQTNLAQLPSEPMIPFIYGTSPTFFRALQGGWAYVAL